MPKSGGNLPLGKRWSFKDIEEILERGYEKHRLKDERRYSALLQTLKLAFENISPDDLIGDILDELAHAFGYERMSDDPAMTQSGKPSNKEPALENDVITNPPETDDVEPPEEHSFSTATEPVQPNPASNNRKTANIIPLANESIIKNGGVPVITQNVNPVIENSALEIDEFTDPLAPEDVEIPEGQPLISVTETVQPILSSNNQKTASTIPQAEVIEKEDFHKSNDTTRGASDEVVNLLKLALDHEKGDTGWLLDSGTIFNTAEKIDPKTAEMRTKAYGSFLRNHLKSSKLINPEQSNDLIICLDEIVNARSKFYSELPSEKKDLERYFVENWQSRIVYFLFRSHPDPSPDLWLQVHPDGKEMNENFRSICTKIPEGVQGWILKELGLSVSIADPLMKIRGDLFEIIREQPVDDLNLVDKPARTIRPVVYKDGTVLKGELSSYIGKA